MRAGTSQAQSSGSYPLLLVKKYPDTLESLVRIAAEVDRQNHTRSSEFNVFQGIC